MASINAGWPWVLGAKVDRCGRTELMIAPRKMALASSSERQNHQRVSGAGLVPLAEGASQLQTNFGSGSVASWVAASIALIPWRRSARRRRLFPHKRVAVAQCGDRNFVAQCLEAIERARGLQAGEGIFPVLASFSRCGIAALASCQIKSIWALSRIHPLGLSRSFANCSGCNELRFWIRAGSAFLGKTR